MNGLNLKKFNLGKPSTFKEKNVTSLDNAQKSDLILLNQFSMRTLIVSSLVAENRLKLIGPVRYEVFSCFHRFHAKSTPAVVDFQTQHCPAFSQLVMTRDEHRQLAQAFPTLVHASLVSFLVKVPKLTDRKIWKLFLCII